MTTIGNIIDFPVRRPAQVEVSDTPAADPEVRVALLEAALANSERALLVLASALREQRALLVEIKVAEGWSWRAKPSAALFGPAALYDTHQLDLVQREDVRP